MPYKSENDLQLDLFETEFELLESRPVYFMRREVRVGECIPDLVSIHFGSDPNIHEWPKKWSYKHSFVIWLLKKWGQLSLEDIAKLSYTNSDHVSSLVSDLLRGKILERKKTGEVKLSKDIRSMQADVIAVEAKLKNWRDALWQATRYQYFANIVIVAMDATYTPRDRTVLDQFSKHRIGLCAVSPGNREWLVHPKQRNDLLGHEKEYLVMSAAIPVTQTLWDKRNNLKASSHA